MVERQKSLVITLKDQGHTGKEIIQLLKKMRNIHYRVGHAGEFAIALKTNDSIKYLLAYGFQPDIKLSTDLNHGLPMRMALKGNSGFIKGRDYQDNSVFAAYTFVPELKWGIVAKIPTQEIYQSYIEAGALSLIFALILITVCVMLFIRITKSLVRNLTESEEHYRSLFENQHIVMLLVEPLTGIIADANPAACRYYRYTHKELTSLNISAINTLAPEEIKSEMQKVLAGIKKHFDFRHRMANGEIRDVEVYSGPIRKKNRIYLYSLVYDVTERIRIEKENFEKQIRLKKQNEEYESLNQEYACINEELKTTNEDLAGAMTVAEELQQQYRLLFENMTNGFALHEMLYDKDNYPTDYRFISVNPAFEKITGISADQYIGKTVLELMPHTENYWIEQYSQVAETGIPSRFQNYAEEFDMYFDVAAFSPRKGFFAVLISDITEQKKSEERYKRITDNLTDYLYTVKVENGKAVETVHNEACIAITGYSPKEFAEDPYLWINMVIPEQKEKVAERFLKILEGEDVSTIEHQIIHKNGNIRWISDTLIPKYDSKGMLISYDGVIKDITERKRSEILLKEKTDEIEAQNEEYKQLNEELYLAKVRAEESDKLKTAFLQNMSHEIRTPMNAIMGFSELLVKQYNNKAKIEQYSSIINQRCLDLLTIINDLLDIAKIESGQLSLNIEQCNLNTFFDELTMFFVEHQKRIEKQHIKLIFHALCDPSGSIIITDKGKLKQIFINLVGNAFKFTENGKIEGGCMMDSTKNLIFYVSDTGIGIPRDKHSVIFERFSQVHQDSNHIYGGTGLGLSIVKGLIGLLDGNIWLESEPGKGTTFYFSIPYKISAPFRPELSIKKEPGEYHFLNKTILIVEDDQYNSELMMIILAETGITMLHTDLGSEAVKIATTRDVDMVLMDIQLPDIDGYEATRQIKQCKPELIILAQTAYASPTDRQMAQDSGCNDYISKPIKRELLLSMISKQFQRKANENTEPLITNS
jgi:PAS domain S-box-containing protein